MKIVPEPSDDEVAAISAALGIYLAEPETVEEIKEEKIAPWVVAARLAGCNIAGGAEQFSASANSIWQISKKMLTAVLLAASMGTASAQSSETVNQPQLALRPENRKTDGNVKVLLATGTKFELDFPDGASVYTLADGNLVGTFSPLSAFSAWVGGNSLTLTARSQDLNQSQYLSQSLNKFTPQINIKPVAYTPTAAPLNYSLPLKPQSPDGDFSTAGGYVIVPGPQSEKLKENAPIFALGGKLYRGSLIIRPSFKGDKVGLSAINLIGMEDYLLSVVPSEVPSLWPKEVLKAQAIAARSYAAANLGKHRADGYDVKATVEDQVYRGVIAEADETNGAVAATSGLVLKHNSQVISAFFHSTSGGSTELAENVWGKPLPYLKSVVDFDDASPAFNWKKTVSATSLASSLGLGDPILGVLVVGRHPGESRRVKDVVVIGKSSARFVSGADLRRMLSLPSTLFSLYQADDSYIFSGRGSGHGLGLSQWGAKALADNGYNAVQILSYYYKDVTIEPVTP